MSVTSLSSFKVKTFRDDDPGVDGADWQFNLFKPFKKNLMFKPFMKNLLVKHLIHSAHSDLKIYFEDVK